MALENVNPTIYQRSTEREITEDEENDDVIDEIDNREVFGILYDSGEVLNMITWVSCIKDIILHNYELFVVKWLQDPSFVVPMVDKNVIHIFTPYLSFTVHVTCRASPIPRSVVRLAYVPKVASSSPTAGRLTQPSISLWVSKMSTWLISGGSRISCSGGGGGVDPLGGVDPQCGCFSVKMYVKMKELGPIGGGMCLPRPPRSTNADDSNSWNRCIPKRFTALIARFPQLLENLEK